MNVIRVILTVIFVLISIILTVVVLAQEGKSAGLSGALGGTGETYWSKNKSRSAEGKLETATRWLVILFLVIAAVLNINF